MAAYATLFLLLVTAAQAAATVLPPLPPSLPEETTDAEQLPVEDPACSVRDQYSLQETFWTAAAACSIAIRRSVCPELCKIKLSEQAALTPTEAQCAAAIAAKRFSDTAVLGADVLALIVQSRRVAKGAFATLVSLQAPYPPRAALCVHLRLVAIHRDARSSLGCDPPPHPHPFSRTSLSRPLSSQPAGWRRRRPPSRPAPRKRPCPRHPLRRSLLARPAPPRRQRQSLARPRRRR